MSPEALVVAVGALRDLSLGVAAGGLLVIAAVLPKGHLAVQRVALITRVASVVWALAAVAFVLVSYANIRNESLPLAQFLEEAWYFVTQIDLGGAYLQMALAALVVSMVAAGVRTPLAAAWALAPVVWAIGWQAQTGHAAGAVDHHLAVSTMFLHLGGSAVWWGVIAVLVGLRGVLGADAKAAISRTSRIAGWGAALVIVSGVGNAWLRMDSPLDLVTTAYGWILVAKMALMSAAVGLAAWHRRVILPRLTEAAVRERFFRVLAVDVAALVGVIVLAAVLSGTAPPVDSEPLAEASPAFYLTGYELPPQPSFANWILLWRLEIIIAFALAAATVVYLRWARRLRRRGDTWPWYRTAWFLTGIGVLVWVSQGAPAVYGKTIFSGHMVEHMFLVMVAPLPLALAAPVTLALRAITPRTDHSRGPREWLLALVESRWVKFLANPVVAAVNFAGSLIVFYYSPIFEFVLRNHAGHIWMFVHFTLAGYFFANALVGIDPGPKRPAYPMRIVLLFATMAFHAFFGVAMMSSEALLAPTYFGLMGRDWGPDAITDQQFGGQLAWGIGEVPVVALAIAVALSWRRDDEKEAKRKDRQADRDGDAELNAYNDMLRGVTERDARD
jgi:putative copper resistance protein D